MACWKEHQSAECLGESNLTVEALCRRMLILDDKKEVWEVHQEDGVEFDPEGSLIKCFPYCFFDSKSAVYAYEPLKTFEEVEAEYIHRLTAIFQELAQGYAAQTLPPMSGVQAVPSGPSGQASKDVRVVLREKKRSILKGLRVAFTSIVERSEKPENNLFYRLLADFGGSYVSDLANGCDLLVCRAVRTAKVNQAQQLRIPVVSVRWLEECAKFWKLYPLEPFYMDFAQDEKQSCILGKREIDAYHQLAKATADTTLFTATEPPVGYLALTQKREACVLVDYDEQILEEIRNSEFREKRGRMSPPAPRTQFSPSIQLPIPAPMVVPFNPSVMRP